MKYYLKNYAELHEQEPHAPIENPAYHGALLQGAFITPDGRVRRGNVPLPLPRQDHQLSQGAHAVQLLGEDGSALEFLGGALPPLIILGFLASPPHPVALDASPAARYARPEIETFGRLRQLIKRAVRHGDPRLLGAVATESARISQRRLPKSRFDAILNIAASYEACGVQVAHRGHAIGMIFDPMAQTVGWRIEQAARALRHLRITDQYRFEVGTGKPLARQQFG